MAARGRSIIGTIGVGAIAGFIDPVASASDPVVDSGFGVGRFVGESAGARTAAGSTGTTLSLATIAGWISGFTSACCTGGATLIFLTSTAIHCGVTMGATAGG